MEILIHEDSENITAKTRTLDQLRVGETATVTLVTSSNPELLQKLLSLGVVKGTTLKVSKISPLGDPISITIRGFELALRKSEARSVHVI
ncbi:MAG: ferrous iron transport protein A [Proteobacteria bacterium]|nr:ferrous iron transport protein A [Pseudomonadota bacterium]